MKKIFLLLSLAVGFAMAQSGTPVTYDDDNRCNNPGATLAPGIYEPSGACQQFGYVCRLSSEASGMVIFWLGADANCTTLHTTQLTTYYPKADDPDAIDPAVPNNDLRITVHPDYDKTNAMGTAVIASQLLSAKIDKAQVSVIYEFVPSSNGAHLNSIHLLSLGRVD